MPKKSANASFLFGTIIGFRGIKGEVKIRPGTTDPELLFDVEIVFRRQEDGSMLELEIESMQLDKRNLLVKFVGYADRNSVEPFFDSQLFMDESDLRPLADNQFWTEELTGMDVYTSSGQFVGKVSSIIPSSNDIIEIKPEGRNDNKTILIPFVKTLVPNIDKEKNRIEVIDMPGLLEPQ